MAFSNTISQTVFDTRKVIENAARRCKVPAQSLSAEHVDIANDQLYLLLSDLANQGAPLWCVEKQIYGLYEGVGQVTTDLGTVDILNANLRTLSEVTGTNTITSTAYKVDFTDDTAVTTAGVLWASASASGLSLQTSPDGSTWTTIQTEDVSSVTAGEWTWFDLDSVVAKRYFRLLATGGTLAYTTVFLGNNPTEIQLSRMNRDDYTNLPNKAFQSNRPLQYWFDRQVRQPIMHLWPTPNAAATTSQITLWRHRHIMDVGAMTQEIEVPQRWLEAVVSMLAAKLAQEYVEVDPQIIPMLDGKAQSALYIAQMEERDNSPMMLQPNISVYTR
jgi:hypothetical protein